VQLFIVLSWVGKGQALLVFQRWLFLYAAQRLAVWLVADFEALSYQVTTTFDTGCAARIRTAPAINYTACCAFGFYLFHFLIVN
jgi:hypothetical protein